jgi:hypothetical protein
MSKTYGIKEAAAFLGINEQYMRKLILDEKIPAQKVRVSPTSDVMKWVVAEEDLVARKSNNHSVRNDGRNKYTIYASQDEIAKLRQLLEANGIEIPEIERTNKPEDVAKRVAKARAKRVQAKLMKQHDLEALKGSLK